MRILPAAKHKHWAQEQPQVFKRLRGKTEGKRSEWEYPFAVAGINLTFMLEALLGFRDSVTSVLIPTASPHTPAGTGFALLMDTSPNLIEEVRILIFFW